MLLDCNKLKHWNIKDILKNLTNKELDYVDLFTLKEESSKGMVLKIPRIWNSLDILNDKTKLLHTTNRITQPWKTGLTIDFTRNKMPKFFGIIPREPIHKILGKYPTRYQSHPNKNIEHFFLRLLKETLNDSVIDKEFIKSEISHKHIRSDIFKKLNMVD